MGTTKAHENQVSVYIGYTIVSYAISHVKAACAYIEGPKGAFSHFVTLSSVRFYVTLIENLIFFLKSEKNAVGAALKKSRRIDK